MTRRLEVEFIDELPPSGSKAGPGPDRIISQFAEALRRNPGRWAKWPKTTPASAANGLVARINTGKRAPMALVDSAFQARSRDGIVYVRYLEADHD